MNKVPTDLHKALSSASKFKKAWQNLTPIARRDFVSWINSAKQVETHKRRIKRACSMLAAGKRRPCCYSIVPMGLYKTLGANPKAQAQWKGLTSDQRRDLVDWIESSKDSETYKLRIHKACSMLAAGKRRMQ